MLSESGIWHLKSQIGFKLPLLLYADVRPILLTRPILRRYQRLVGAWNHLTSEEVADKVKFFFRMYSINRHKTTVLYVCLGHAHSLALCVSVSVCICLSRPRPACDCVSISSSLARALSERRCC